MQICEINQKYMISKCIRFAVLNISNKLAVGVKKKKKEKRKKKN